MKVLSLISSLIDPAPRFRIITYQKYFERLGHQLFLKKFSPERDSDPPRWTYTLKKVSSINEWRIWNLVKQLMRSPFLMNQINHDIIWQNRLIVPYNSFIERNIYKPFVFDFDDAVWMIEGFESFKKVVTKADLLFAGNEYLAEYASKYNKKISIVPTTIDTEIFKPQYQFTDTFTLGWIGTESNFKYLEIIKKPVIDYLSMNKKSRLVIVSDRMPPNIEFDNNQTIFKKWSAEKENELINQFSIGLMPLDDNEWTKGKCSYKMLQYLACGKPVVVSPVGMNKKLLNESEIGFSAENESKWVNAFNTLCTDKSLYNHYSQNGVALVNEKYSCVKWSSVILSNFTKLL